MDATAIIRHLQACIDDGEWERAEASLSELRLPELVATTQSPRIVGAIAHTLSGIASAVERRNGPAAHSALGHLAFLIGDHGPAAEL